MKSNQVLKIVGGIVGLGITGVITTLLLTSDEKETLPKQAGSGGELIRSGVHVPITLQDANRCDDPNPEFVAGQPIVLTLHAPAPPDESGPVGFSVYVSALTLFDPMTGLGYQTALGNVTKPRRPVPVTLGDTNTFELLVEDTGHNQVITVIAYGVNPSNPSRSYGGELMITVTPPQL